MEAMKRTPTKPARADHRLMLALVKTNHAKEKLDPTPEEFDKIGRVFVKAGGSWERVFKGSVRDTNLLKRVIKIAAEKGHLSKAVKWG